MRRVLVLGLVLAALALPDAGLAWSWPVDGEVLQGFSVGSDPYAAGQHRGIDVAAVEGEPVLAPAGGQVTFAGVVPSRGRSVSILTPSGFSVTLSHLGELTVSKGGAIAEGEAVGRAGRSGTQDHPGPYVQLGIRDASDPNGYRDPLTFLPARAAPAPPASGDAPAEVPAAVPATEAPAAGVPAVDAPATDAATTDSPGSSPTAAHPNGMQPTPAHSASFPPPDAGSTEPSAPVEQPAPAETGSASPAAAAQPVATGAVGAQTASTPTPSSGEVAGGRPAASTPSVQGAHGGVSTGGGGLPLAPREATASSSGEQVVSPSRSTGSDLPGAVTNVDRVPAPGSERSATGAGRDRVATGGATSVSRSQPGVASDRDRPLPPLRGHRDSVVGGDGVTMDSAHPGIGGIAARALVLAILVALLTMASAVVSRGRTLEVERVHIVFP